MLRVAYVLCGGPELKAQVCACVCKSTRVSEAREQTLAGVHVMLCYATRPNVPNDSLTDDM